MNNKIAGKILIHIAFHFIERRFVYLKQIIENFDTYGFDEVDIVIDTNSEDTKKLVQKSIVFHKGKLECAVHKNLSHPYLLTWTHREDMLQKINKYDFFMYVEDDILVPWRAILLWHIDTEIICPHGFVRGFLIVEKNSVGTLMATSIKQKFSPKIIKIKNESYFISPWPYHAFWIYTKEQMKEFITLKSWKDGNHNKWDVRARAAAGMMWKEQNCCRALVPIGEKNKILEETFVYHLPNTYTANKKSIFSKIPVNDMFCGKIEGFARYIYRESYFQIKEIISKIF
jgi:hypothetical protein